MKKQLIGILSVICLTASASSVFAAVKTPTAPAIAQETIKQGKYHQPAAFIVLDRTGQVNSTILADWKQQVKQAYRIPYYSIIDTREANLAAQEVIASEGKNANKLDIGTFRKIAAKTNSEVVTLMVINDMSEEILHTRGGGGPDGWDGPEEYIRVWTEANLYVYKKDGDRLLRENINESDTTDLSLETKPETVIKYAMRKLVNKMENRPQI